MADDYDYSDWRDSREFEQEMRESLPQEEMNRIERRKEQSVSQTVVERREGYELSQHEIEQKVLNRGDERAEDESIYDWLSEEEAMKLKSFRKRRDHWREMLSREDYKAKLEEMAQLVAKAKRRIENET